LDLYQYLQPDPFQPLLGRWWGLEPAALQVAMILMACPTAIISYTMVLAIKGDEAMASTTIVVSVVCSLATLALIVGFF
jgi:predicted permease